MRAARAISSPCLMCLILPVITHEGLLAKGTSPPPLSHGQILHAGTPWEPAGKAMWLPLVAGVFLSFLHMRRQSRWRWGSYPCLSHFSYCSEGALCPPFVSTVPIPPGAQCPQGATLKPCQAWHSSLGQDTCRNRQSLEEDSWSTGPWQEGSA